MDWTRNKNNEHSFRFKVFFIEKHLNFFLFAVAVSLFLINASLNRYNENVGFN